MLKYRLCPSLAYFLHSFTAFLCSAALYKVDEERFCQASNYVGRRMNDAERAEREKQKKEKEA